MNTTQRRGPKRRYNEAEEQAQRDMAQSLVDAGATWSEIITAFGAHGWNLSHTTLKLRFAEWGIRR